MANKKKKTAKHKKQPQFKGHYCKVCGEHKANEKFSGRGHAAHICKSCASKSPEEKAEDMMINKLYGMSHRYINDTEIKWLKNRMNDSRPEVRELARQIFEGKFPRLARNEIKQTLHIQNLLFHVHGEIYDDYGDEYNVNIEYAADTSGKIIRKSYDENNALTNEKTAEIGQSAIRKFFNIAVHNRDISFWETDLCREISYDPNIDLLSEYRDDLDYDDKLFEDDEQEQIDIEPESREYLWSVGIRYKNGTEQNIKGYDYIPDPVMELYLDFETYFEDDFADGDEDFGGE